MNFVKKYAVILAVAISLSIAPAFAEAATYDASTASVYARLQALVLEVQKLQRELLLIQSRNVETRRPLCYPYARGGQYCIEYDYSHRIDASERRGEDDDELEDIDVEFDDDIARITVEYDDETDYYALETESESEVIEFLIDETDLSRGAILRHINFDEDDNDNDDDVEDIDVEIEDGDAKVRVRYEDGDTDKFTIENETNRNDIIEEIADELDMDEDDVRDITEFDYSNVHNDEDVESIDVKIDEDDEDATARVEYEDGDTDTFYYDTDDEDEIIEELSDDLDMDEDDVEDLADFDYV